jgi:lipoate-protein ligase A
MTIPRVLHVFEDGALDGPENMARDEHLLESEGLPPAALRLYGWDPPTISLGYFQRLADVERLPRELRELAIVRRLTGGGAILHDRELTYALVLDDSVPIASHGPADLYRLVHTCWRDALSSDGPLLELAPDDYPLPTPRTGPFFCFQKPGRTDLILGEQKVLGSAQRRTGGRVLQHGSLLLGRRFADHPGGHLNDPPVDRVRQWTRSFIDQLSHSLALTPVVCRWTDEQLRDVRRRRQRYQDAAWTGRL